MHYSPRVIGRRAWLAQSIVGAGALLTPLGALAQSASGTYRVGWLSPAGQEAGGTNLDALREGLSALGYQEGRNLTIESRWAEGGSEQLPGLARELINLKVDVICTAGTQATRAARGATSTVPVIFANVAFPVQQQLVASYARPGGNVTGVAFDGAEYGKRLELLKEIAPRLARVALIYNPENQGAVIALDETRRWARSLSVTVEPYRMRGPHDLDEVFSGIARSHPDAMMTTADPLIASYRGRIVAFAAKQRLISMYPGKEYLEVGGLVFYGGSIREMYRRVAVYVDRIRKGAKPSELPVEQPTKFDTVINARAARTLGLTIPAAVLLRADQVLE